MSVLLVESDDKSTTRVKWDLACFWKRVTQSTANSANLHIHHNKNY